MDVKHEEIPLLQRKVVNVRKATMCATDIWTVPIRVPSGG